MPMPMTISSHVSSAALDRPPQDPNELWSDIASILDLLKDSALSYECALRRGAPLDTLHKKERQSRALVADPIDCA